MTESASRTWGRVADDGTVYVIDNGAERAVGQYPDGTPEEALEYFTRKFHDLEGQVALLEQRVRNGAPASDVAKSARHLHEQLADANAVGDLASLRSRLDALDGSVSELTEQQKEEAQAALAAAIAEREQIVLEAEAIAAQDPSTIQWKQTSKLMDDLFARWQRHQQEGPRLPKADANALWARFRTARGTFDAGRRHFFAQLDAKNKQVREAKERLIARAEELAPRGADCVPAYRDLLAEWKAAGRAGRKHDDALWARFKAAGDVLFAAKHEIDARENEEYQANLDAKLALLADAEGILQLTDRTQAREQLNQVQQKWDAIGRVPRAQFREVEDRLRAIEQHVRKLDDEHWQRSNPEKKARSEGMQAQLEAAIAKLEDELAAAQASGNARAIAKAEEALEARRSWLKAVAG